MGVLIYVLIGITSLVVLFLLLALIGPSNYKVIRSIKISAPVKIIFDQTSIYANWDAWSPWARVSEDTKYTIENDNQVVGSSMSWKSTHKKVGEGMMTTAEIVPNEKFLYNMAFYKPFEMTSHGGFLYTQKGDEILLEWYDEGDFTFMQRPMMLFMNLEKMIGPMFELGLAEIKVISEKHGDNTSS